MFDRTPSTHKDTGRGHRGGTVRVMVPAEHPAPLSDVNSDRDDSATTRDSATTATRDRRSGLQPFRKGDPRTAELAKKGADTRRANAAARKASTRATADTLRSVRDTFTRGELGESSAAVAGWLLGRIAAGAIPVRNAGEAADLLRALVDVARLEAGQATSTALVAHVGTGATAEVLALRDKARVMLGTRVDDQDAGPLSTAATAADDSGHQPS